MTLPQREIKLQFTEEGVGVFGNVDVLRLVKDTEHVFDVLVQQQDSTLMPPAFVAVDILGWAARWVGKLDIADFEVPAAKWDVSAVIQGASTDGRFRFTIPKATMNFIAELGYSEIIIMTNGTVPDLRIPVIWTAVKPAILV